MGNKVCALVMVEYCCLGAIRPDLNRLENNEIQRRTKW